MRRMILPNVPSGKLGPVLYITPSDYDLSKLRQQFTVPALQ